jgi:sugar phosphate isomerase/epimerase
MKLIFFTKFLKGLNAEQIAEIAIRLGFDGLDLAVRAGHCVNPGNIREELPKALKLWREAGLSVPLVTLEGNATDPKQAESIFAACGENGVPLIKLGYWVWQPGQEYWREVATIRKALARFEKLGEKYGVCSLLHTHSDEYYGSNASGAMELLRGFDPRYVGVYLDPAHLALDGEYFAMALAIARDYLKMIGVKNVRPVRNAASGEWIRDWCALEEGLVNWPEALRLLREIGYDGSLSVHGEYSASDDMSEVLKRAAEDLAYLKLRLRSSS